MKRVGHLFEKLLSDENLTEAIATVCDSHRWIRYPVQRNKTVVRMEENTEKYVGELRELIVNGFVPSEVRILKRYDANAGKWREISEPKIWPDQCVHHALIQAIEPVLMRGMDHWCCGSIKGRGTHYGVKAMKKWINRKGANWCVELDIRHFYNSLTPEVVMRRMKQLIKDHRVLDLIERVIADGVLIGAYCSQWFANSLLQPLDQEIRKIAIHYVRYMDNFTILTRRKRDATEIIRVVSAWLEAHGLRLKDNWQKFRITKRLPNALGYRFGRGYVLLRKKNLKRLKRALKRFYTSRIKRTRSGVKFAQGLLSRLGQLRHCNSVALYKRLIKPKTQRNLKNIIREEVIAWNTSLVLRSIAA